ncbi:ParB N-terminal domain-containing protein [Glaesserella parasuis]|uniref:ParB N-terminal domain-containing protein n=1 Tax=Glaesserella parasuis TaxID=738 RepID=A0AA42EFC6_GLAPU|nr:ParB N-terminal domain-containing protein [Glaesserella parasuis]MDD2167270.1 ParB N-terminal domain-containing protein [Glaesserella parasuis]MDE4014946.1 ParB N-terminal domain-containing protein [Glaesserella parasuis]MDG6346081.1 ParB N-terminal domain-containing protein [Glaesserella parasuis]MDG6771754.1 ParB N-terminal domain-containing protein [Glaesserella parasuis]MDO9665614.1 ParB N-terminal domain-containing protein [Glaesserella parasuis]
MTKDEKRLAAIAKGLNVSPISNTAPSYQTVAPTHYSSDVEYITVTLDKLRPYEHNPRKTRNPNFEMIKESIRRRGLDHKPNITRRPGEDFYIIADGGIRHSKSYLLKPKIQNFGLSVANINHGKGILRTVLKLNSIYLSGI